MLSRDGFPESIQVGHAKHEEHLVHVIDILPEVFQKHSFGRVVLRVDFEPVLHGLESYVAKLGEHVSHSIRPCAVSWVEPRIGGEVLRGLALSPRRLNCDPLAQLGYEWETSQRLKCQRSRI